MQAIKQMPEVAAGLAAAAFTLLGMLAALFGLIGSKPTIVSATLLVFLCDFDLGSSKADVPALRSRRPPSRPLPRQQLRRPRRRRRLSRLLVEKRRRTR
jgi:hypothetical protein